jgi:copper chaperone CopZ
MDSVNIEHEIADGKTVLEEFEGVESITNPPMTETIHLSFKDDRDRLKLRYGEIVKVN